MSVGDERASEQQDRGDDPLTPAQPVAEPLTASLMGRLFVVPALIVCALLAVAIVVVLFGASPMNGPESIEKLLARLETDAGDRTLGQMLLTKDKAYWQAAQDLSRRLAKKETFLKPEEIEPTALRLIAILKRLGPGRSFDEAGARQQYFVMMALARLETASGVAPLVAHLTDRSAGARIAALRALAEMRAVPAARQAVGTILPLLEDDRGEVVMVACAAVSGLADRGDGAVIEALERAMGSDEVEVGWNAAMALARLGSVRGKLLLMNMLERPYWERIDLSYEQQGSLVRRKYSADEVSIYLKAAIEAASHLDDADLAGLIRALRDDVSHVVREAARLACERMDTRGGERTGEASVPVAPIGMLWRCEGLRGPIRDC